MRLYEFPLPVRHSAGRNTGLFFCLPVHQQHQRIRQMFAARFSPAQIASTCRLPLAEVSAILGVRQ